MLNKPQPLNPVSPAPKKEKKTTVAAAVIEEPPKPKMKKEELEKAMNIMTQGCKTT